MKKMLSGFLAFLILFSLTGCSSGNDPAEEETETTSAVSVEPAEPTVPTSPVPTQQPSEEPTQQPSEEASPSLSEDVSMAKVQEFMDLVNQYSDPPSLEGEELDAYDREQYDTWRAGEGYQFIIEDSDGHPMVYDCSDYCGEWWDTYSQRCHMTIEPIDDVTYQIEINWSSSAWDNTHWVFTASYDSTVGGLAYIGNRYEEHTGEDGITESTVAADGKGTIWMDSDGKIYWNDFVENQGKECVFERNSESPQ